MANTQTKKNSNSSQPQVPPTPSTSTSKGAPVARTQPPAKTAGASSASQTQPKRQATLHFERNWAHRVEGELFSGGRLTLRYDGERMAEVARQTPGIQLKGAVQAHVQFEPGGLLVQGLAAQPFSVDIPAGATRAEVWFKQDAVRNGHDHPAYDSHFGHNYHFAIDSEG